MIAMMVPPQVGIGGRTKSWNPPAVAVVLRLAPDERRGERKRGVGGRRNAGTP
jgi:hypothetical protein